MQRRVCNDLPSAIVTCRLVCAAKTPASETMPAEMAKGDTFVQYVGTPAALPANSLSRMAW